MATIQSTRVLLPVSRQQLVLFTTLALIFFGLCSLKNGFLSKEEENFVLQRTSVARDGQTFHTIERNTKADFEVKTDVSDRHIDTSTNVNYSQTHQPYNNTNSTTIISISHLKKTSSHSELRIRGKIVQTGNDDHIKDVHPIKPTTTSTPLVTKPLSVPPNCTMLFQGSKPERNHVKRLLENFPYKFLPNMHFVDKTQDCDRFRDEMGYHSKPMSQEEAEFPIAFAIRLYDKVAQAERLLRTIYMPQNIYCIYIDKKADKEVHLAMEAIAYCFPNVFIASKLENVYYQSFSPVQADMQCMQDVLSTSVKWKYFINVAGSEFPLRTNLEMVQILKVLNGTNDIEQFPFPPLYDYRIKKVYKIRGNDTVSTGRYKPPFLPQLDLQKGCSYNLFSRQFVEWVLSDDLAQRFINWTKDTMAPDETVWGTLNHLPQAPGGYQQMVTQISKTLLAREVIWQWSNAYCWGQRFVRGVCILSSGDLHWLGRRWEFFANKFDAEFDHIALDCLEERHNHRTLNPDPENNVNWDVIMRMPQVEATKKRKEKSLSLSAP